MCRALSSTEGRNSRPGPELNQCSQFSSTILNCFSTFLNCSQPFSCFPERFSIFSSMFPNFSKEIRGIFSAQNLEVKFLLLAIFNLFMIRRTSFSPVSVQCFRCRLAPLQNVFQDFNTFCVLKSVWGDQIKLKSKKSTKFIP